LKDLKKVSDFDKPLDTWIEEEVPVTKNKVTFDPKTKTVKVNQVVEMEKQKTIYINATPRKISCPPGKHEWFCKDEHTYIFGCRNCKRTTKVYPVFWRFEDGHLISKVTGEYL